MFVAEPHIATAMIDAAAYLDGLKPQPEVVNTELLEAARGYVDTLYWAARTNDEWGRVVTGQTDAARELKAIFDRLFAQEKSHDA
jgi:hypothetical protein